MTIIFNKVQLAFTNFMKNIFSFKKHPSPQTNPTRFIITLVTPLNLRPKIY